MSLIKKKNKNIRIIPLGGVGEIAKNMYIVEVDDEMFMLDAGLMFPEDEMLGVDVVIPDIQYVIENKHRLKGIFLTHGHEHAIGAASYVLEQVDAPVYGSRLTLALVKESVKARNINKKIRYYVVNDESVMRFKSVNVTFFNTTHSIPDSLGVCIHTSYGAIVYTGEFKFDQSLHGHYEPDLKRMTEIGEEGVFALISDSVEAEKPGYNTPENVIESHMYDAFTKVKGRLIVSCYASNFVRIQQVLNIASRLNRKVSFLGRSLETSFNIARKMGYFDIPRDLLIPIKEVENYPKNEVIIIATGMQGEPVEALNQMALQQHKIMNIEKGDSVFLAITASASMEVIVGNTLNELARAGAEIIPNNKKIHASSHGCMEELKMMINMMKPEYFIPVNGEFKMQIAHAKLANESGVDPEKIFLVEKGDVVNYDGKDMILNEKVNSGNVLIDGLGVGDVGNIVLRDRHLLAEDGIFIAVVTLDSRNRRIAAGPEIQSRGFVYVRESEELLQEAEEKVREIVEQGLQEKRIEWSDIKQNMRDQISKLLFESTKRRPMIIPVISEI
ncbi:MULTISPECIES: ribonuclease J2 [Staphylococcus]|uniref:Ribonuclease J n=2 Tax=Staphylococcus pettenkoferi TaxID=170573 RepID=A0A1Z3TY62_9STAP|nr:MULTISPECIES: ribonuclease J [Staphylococcus]ASE35946.1 ribonuclease J [Staphylococcus pettenkoferi]EHM68853.1 ribonuclease J 2 [Staphylococcus pettenkoferi VCU012]MCI2790262.1 ribonuclease J [Staphylococcus pettenkoferi]MCI2802474.1 ribonuclease J [Staphylococcus pettenkoferi]MCY1563930.1 ribonuclease J [Staphylococcus pettenkoferi]